MSQLIVENLNNFKNLEARPDQKTPPPGDSPRHLFDIITNNTLSAPTHPKIAKSEMVKSVSLDVPFTRKFPTELIQNFEKTVLIDKLGFGVSPKRQKQLFVLWKKAQSVLASVDVPVSYWSTQEALIYASATKLAMHPNYFRKVLGLINEFGFFYAMTTGTSFNKIRAPKGFAKERMMTQLEKAGRDLSRACKPLSPLILSKHGSRLREAEKNFLECCMWFGLRPSELVAAVKDRSVWRVVELNGRTYLDVYQNKLGQLARDARWKRIPVAEPEQVRCLELIKAGAVKKPSNWMMNAAFGKGFGIYSPRKGFAALMLSRGWKLEAISKMLGHGSIETTKTYYIGHQELLDEEARLAVAEKRAS